MKDDLDFWQHRKTLSLAEAALLILGKSPDKWLHTISSDATPNGFKAILGMMISDAKDVVCEDAVSEEDGSYYCEYTLTASEYLNPKQVSELTEHEWQARECDMGMLRAWVKSNSYRLPVGFFNDDISKLKKAEDTDKPLKDSEKASLLKIIAALAVNGYKYPNRGAQAEILKDFEINGNGVTENTLSRYLNEAKQYTPASPEKP